MWQRTACFVALLVAHEAALTVSGQDRRAAPLPIQAPQVRYEIVLGRITCLHLNNGQCRLQRGTEPDAACRESLLIHCEGRDPILRYERSTAGEDIVVAFTRGNQLRIERTFTATGRRVEFVQPARGDVSLTLHSSSGKEVLTAPSFWHLMLAERPLCEQELTPVLKLLRPNWDFLEQSLELEHSLFHTALHGEPVPRARLSELVRELGSAEFARRQVADQQLRALGPAILPYLASLSPEQLSGEQRHRLRHIRDSLASAAIDTPDRVALWLVDDERIWLTMLEHPDAEKRHLALLRLGEIRPEATYFDPYGDDQFRAEQVAQLRSMIEQR